MFSDGVDINISNIRPTYHADLKLMLIKELDNALD